MIGNMMFHAKADRSLRNSRFRALKSAHILLIIILSFKCGHSRSGIASCPEIMAG